LGLLLLAQILKSQGHDVRIIDFVFLQSCKGLRPPSLAQEIRDYLPDVVGISIFTYHYDEALETIDLVNRTTDAPIVLGGPHVSIFPDDFAYDTRISYLVCGEAESEIVSVVEQAKRQSEPMIIRCQPVKPEEIPQASLEPLYGVEYLKEYQIQLSRGCPFQCSFCVIGQTAGRRIRERPLEQCIQELSNAKNKYPQIMSIAITDDCPTFHKERFKGFLNSLASAKLGCMLTIDNLRAKDVDEELIELCKKAGGRNLCIGVESGNVEVFEGLNKGETLEEIKHAAQIIRNKRLALGLCFVIGLPGDNILKHRDSIVLAKAMKADYIYWNMLVPWPGTRVEEWYQKNGGIGEMRNFSTLISPDLSWQTPPVWSGSFPSRDLIRAWLSANLETYCISMRFKNLLRIIKVAREYELWRSAWIYFGGKLPHYLAVNIRTVYRIARSLGPLFLVKLITYHIVKKIPISHHKVGD